MAARGRRAKSRQTQQIFIGILESPRDSRRLFGLSQATTSVF